MERTDAWCSVAPAVTGSTCTLCVPMPGFDMPRAVVEVSAGKGLYDQVNIRLCRAHALVHARHVRAVVDGRVVR